MLSNKRKRVYIATSRRIGEECKKWARKNTPKGFEIVDTMNHCDILISVLYDKLLSPEYLEGLKGKAFNFHPSILPEYRGSAGCSWVIANKEKETGVALHVIDNGADTGDIIDIKKFPIKPYDTAYSLFLKIEMHIYKMFKAWFKELLMGRYKPVKQDETKAKKYMIADLNNLKDITHIVRALHFPDKESCYYINIKGEKKYINYEE